MKTIHTMPYQLIGGKEITRQDWLIQRQNGIGGSDAPALLLSEDQYKWNRPLDVYKSKTQPVSADDQPNLSCRFGTYNEPFVAQLFEEESGLKVRNFNRTFCSKQYPFMLANIDRKIIGKQEGLECKTTQVYNKKKFTEEEFPLNYYVQIQHYLAVTGWDRWYLATLVGNAAFYWYTVERDEDVINQLIEVENEFWNHVQKQENIWE